MIDSKLNVPELRFNGFKNDWTQRILSDITYRVCIKNNNLVSQNQLTISAEFGFISQKEFFNKIVASDNLETYIVVHNGDFAYNKSYSRNYPWGAIKRLDNYEDGVVSPLYICFRNNPLLISDFAVQYFETKKWHQGISEIALEGARNHGLLNVSVIDFFNTKHFIPELTEQRKIADFLSLVDQSIENLEEKIRLLELQKKGIMENIFSQKLRINKFEDPWNSKVFGDLVDFLHTNSLSREQLTNVDGKVQNIHYGDIHTKFGMILDAEEETLPLIRNNTNLSFDEEDFCRDMDIVFADASEDYEGVGKAIELMNIGNKKICSGLHTVLARQKVDVMYPGFMGYLMNCSIIHDQIRFYAVGTNVYSISKANLSKVIVTYPSKSEQKMIVEILRRVDQRVLNSKKMIDQKKLLKSGLMSKMFI